MTQTLEHPSTVELIAIPTPKFKVGDRVNIADNEFPFINIIQGWCWVPFDPNDPRFDRQQYPVQEGGIYYFVEQQALSTNFYETIHEEDLSLCSAPTTV